LQRVCAVPGGVNAYLRDPDGLVSAETLVCPFCPDGHRLHRHGYYHRYALFLAPDPSLRIPVRRLLCPVVGRTVSLLPDFCLPRRQHGPAILAVFLYAFAVLGLPLALAMKKARPDVTTHSTAQSLRRGFLSRAILIRAYLAGIRHRFLPPPDTVPHDRRELAALVNGIVHRSATPDRAFLRHGRCFFARFGTGLA